MLINKDIKYKFQESRNCFAEESVPVITVNDSQ
jgi:hypothetical protein